MAAAKRVAAKGRGGKIAGKGRLGQMGLRALNNLAEQYLFFAEGQAMRRIPMHMKVEDARLPTEPYT